jgi:arylsulfatase A-like enzyme
MGFHLGDDEFRIRFCPTRRGQWDIIAVRSNVGELEGQHVGDHVTAMPSGHHGFWIADEQSAGRRWYRRSDGSHQYVFGNTHYSFLSGMRDTGPSGNDIAADLAANAEYFRKVRFSLCSDRYPHPTEKPFLDDAGRPTDDGDYSHRPNPRWFRERVDHAVQSACSHDLIADLILAGPDTEDSRATLRAGANGGDATPYLRYVAARYGSYPNVWLCLCNEYDIKEPSWQPDDMARFGESIRRFLPYPVPLSVHASQHPERGARKPEDPAWSRAFDALPAWNDHQILQRKLRSLGPSADVISRAWQFPGSPPRLRPTINDELSYQGEGDRHSEGDTIESHLGAFLGGGYASTGEKRGNKLGHYFWGAFDPGEHTAARSLGWLRSQIDEHITFWEMAPDSAIFPGLDPDFRAMAWPGHEYVLGTNRAAEVVAQLPAGAWTVRQFDVIAREMQILTKAASGRFTLRTPDSRAVLYHFRATEPSTARSSASSSDPSRPNVLWITSEDNSPYLGCYGDRLAKTPHLDRLAAAGVRYRHAFANAPVCSTSRTTLITGMYASSLGVHHHRSSVAIPDQFRLYPEHLRAAGYYCTNNSKTDYNVAGRRATWDESSATAHYRRRSPGQPFFAIFNLTTTHESRVAPPTGKSQFRVAPGDVPLPPYHPDTPEIRSDWANYYDQMTLMDEQVGALLDELAGDGLDDDTIVFYFSDHGGALPRGKRNLHDSGTRVPLIIRFPPRWAHLAPAAPGEWVDELVSFVDLPVTLFSLCGVPRPAHYEGGPFLGADRAPPRTHVYLLRGRMDERYDTVRSVRDAEYRYVRNFSPHRPWGQHYSYPFQVLPSMRSWHAAYEAGQCDAAQGAYWQPKPPEELYRVTGDPFELVNLIADPAHATPASQLRAALRSEILSTRDAGLIPEGMASRLAEQRTIYDYAQSDAYPLERILELAEHASEGDAAHLPLFEAGLEDPHPVIRYWAATGCLVLRDRAASAKSALLARLRDDWNDVRVVAAEAVAHLGEVEASLDTLRLVLKTGQLYEVLAAQNALDFLYAARQVPLRRAQDLVRDSNFGEPADRIPRYLLSLTP